MLKARLSKGFSEEGIEYLSLLFYHQTPSPIQHWAHIFYGLHFAAGTQTLLLPFMSLTSFNSTWTLGLTICLHTQSCCFLPESPLQFSASYMLPS